MASHPHDDLLPRVYMKQFVPANRDQSWPYRFCTGLYFSLVNTISSPETVILLVSTKNRCVSRQLDKGETGFGNEIVVSEPNIPKMITGNIVGLPQGSPYLSSVWLCPPTLWANFLCCYVNSLLLFIKKSSMKNSFALGGSVWRVIFRPGATFLLKETGPYCNIISYSEKTWKTISVLNVTEAVQPVYIA